MPIRRLSLLFSVFLVMLVTLLFSNVFISNSKASSFKIRISQAGISSQIVSENILPEPTPTEEPSSSPIGTLGIFLLALAIVSLGILGSGLWILRLRKITKLADETPTIEISTTVDERLEQFRKDLFVAYFSVEAKKHHPKFIPLKVVRDELSSKYTIEQFEKLLRLARQKYPDNIWIDRDSKNQPVYIKLIR